MKRLVLAIALICALSGAALAGEVPTTGIVGDIPSTDSSEPGEMPTIDLSVLLTILGLTL